MPTFFYALYAVFLGCWIFTLVAPALVIRCSSRKPFRRTVIFSLVALVIALLGSTQFYVSSTFETNGHTRRYDSRWLFLASLLLNGLAFGYILWKRNKSRTPAGNQPPLQ